MESLHVGVVIGDFNESEHPCPGTEAHLIDADSFEYGGFTCGVFTGGFWITLLADPAAPRPVQARGYSAESDWYAFAALAMQTLLCVGPYGGVYRPKSASARVYTTRGRSTGSRCFIRRWSIRGRRFLGVSCRMSCFTR
ncbi:MAG: hypothetical protein R3F14_41890 [Polyangiaceae bacterium]